MLKIIVLSASLGLAAAWVNQGDARVEYTRLDSVASEMRDAFNESADRVRLVAYVAPTCGGCLRGAKLMQERVLEAMPGADIEVFVVWVPKNGARERHVDRVLGLVEDARAHHYWDAHGFVVDALDEPLGLTGRACAGAFLIYGPGVLWNDEAAPPPTYWSDAHAGQFEQHGDPFDPETLLAELQVVLARVAL